MPAEPIDLVRAIEWHLTRCDDDDDYRECNKVAFAALAKEREDERGRIIAALREPDAVKHFAMLIVAERGRGHNDPPLYCDYDTAEQERYLDQAMWLVHGLADWLENSHAKAT